MSIGSGIQVLHRSPGCEGEIVVIGRGGEGEGVGTTPELALASALGELEASGARPATVVLRLSRKADAGWAGPAMAWLHQHGRRTLLRSSVALPRGLADGALAAGATVALELAHHRPAIQRALLGPEADPAAALLLQAQHLGARGLGVGAALGPLMPGIHDRERDRERDREDGLAPLLHHVRAADLRHVHVSVARLTAARLRALAGAVDEAAGLAIRRAYGVVETVGEAPGPWRLGRLAHAALREGARARAREHGLRVDACGCAGFCHLDGGGRPPYTPVLGRGLFEVNGEGS